MEATATDKPVNITIVRSEVAKQIKERRLMRAHLAPFVKKVFQTVDPKTVYLHSWHIDLICEYLEAVTYKEIQNLIINIPPRFLKSIISSVSWPAWLLGKNPSDQIIAASYGSNLSTKHSVDCRLVIESSWYRTLFPHTIIAKDQNEKSRFQTTQRGHRMATSVGAQLLGEGGDKLILDDPIDNKRAISEAERKATNEWIDQTWSTRKNNFDTSSEVIVMQRLHVKDPTGIALEKDPESYTHVAIPQEAETKTIVIFPRSKKRYTRQPGSFIHPARFSTKAANNAKKRLGTYGYAGQQQQRPTPLGGGRIKLEWFPRYTVLPKKFDETIISMDTAQKPKDINDPSVLQVYKRSGPVWYLTHQWKERVAYPTLKAHTKSAIKHFKPDAILIEDKSTGSSLIQELELLPNKPPVVPIEPEADKITRMDTQSPSIEAGCIYLPHADHYDYAWLYELEERLMHFPAPASWDEIDAMSQFLKHIRQRDLEKEDIPAPPIGITSSSHWRSAHG